MSYATEKKKYNKERIQIVEMELNYCANTLGIAPCTASSTGDDKCFNTLETTQDLPNYVSTTKTYSFCTQRSPHPTGLSGVIPSIISINVTPSKIDPKGGLGVRASASISFKDHPHSDIDIDKYIDDRTWIAFERGTFWTKLRARNPNYQFKALRILTGYLVDGEFLAENFQTQHFVINRLDVSNGQATITAKDPLTLAMSKKAQVPAPNSGTLNAGITDVGTGALLIPSGVGNLEYDTSGFLLIKSEIMSFTRAGDVLTLTRGGQKGTDAIAHSAGDTVQQCYERSGASEGQLDFIVDDLLTNFANIDPAFIPTTSWNAEVDTFLPGLLDGLIPKPMDVFKVLRELSEAMPFYLWWDERAQLVQLTALKAPPINADVLDMNENLVKKSVRVVDKPDQRISTVFINFDIQNRAKSLTDVDNWGQTYVRVDTDSINKYGSSEVKTISSRWISGTNKATALQAAALIGRRGSNIPREINFSLEAKDDDLWLGQIRSLNYRDMVDATGLPVDTMFQITSAGESKNFNYVGLEFNYGEAVASDEGSGGGEPGVDLILLSTSDKDINLRTIYDNLFPTPDGSTVAKFVLENGTVIGGSVLGSAGMDTGSWPGGAVITLQINSGGFAVGRGGQGRHGSATPAAEAGSLAIILNHDLTLVNNGVIGGGGGGGGSASKATSRAAGGGGAGFDVGPAGLGTTSSEAFIDSIVQASVGNLETGGGGGKVTIFGIADPKGGTGGALGSAGLVGNNPLGGGSTTSGGAAGDAIDKNGFTLDEVVTGTIHGSIIT